MSREEKIVCPYCGNKKNPERGNEDGIHSCASCKKKFRCDSYFYVSYTTKKIEDVSASTSRWIDAVYIEGEK